MGADVEGRPVAFDTVGEVADGAGVVREPYEGSEAGGREGGLPGAIARRDVRKVVKVDRGEGARSVCVDTE